MSFFDAIETVGKAIDAVGVAVIAVGALIAAAAVIPQLQRKTGDAYLRFRQQLGRSILLGLEFLVAADIIRTVAVTPNPRSVAVLAGIVLIRTFLSFSLELEITGYWPWQKGRQQQATLRARRCDARDNHASAMSSASSVRLISPRRPARTSTEGWPSKWSVVKNGEAGSWVRLSLSASESTHRMMTSV